MKHKYYSNVYTELSIRERSFRSLGRIEYAYSRQLALDDQRMARVPSELLIVDSKYKVDIYVDKKGRRFYGILS